MAIEVTSPFWDNSYAFVDGRNPTERHVSRLLGRPGLRALQELMLTLNGATSGSTAAASYPRPAHPASGGLVGGQRTIETVYYVNRATDADDKTGIDTNVLAYTVKPSTYPTNADGNPRDIEPAS